MAFIISGGNVISFAEYEDVLARDQRLFEANEGLTDVIVEDALERATERILTLIRATDWWRNYYIRKSGVAESINYFTSPLISVPQPDPNKIKARQSDFTDLCVYYALSEILLPKVADFGNDDTAERQKMGYYDEKFRALLRELIEAGDWYDFSGSGTITADEKAPNYQNLVRRR